MQRIILIRHGKTRGNTEGRYIGTTDEPLMESEAGDLEKYSIGPVDAVFSSPMKRCMMTAQILFPRQALQLVKNLRECDFGDFENKNYQEMSGDPIYQAWLDSGGMSGFPGGETVEEFTDRTVKGFRQISRTILERGYQTAAVVCHGGTIMSLLSAYGFPERDYYSWHVENGEGYVIRCDAEQFLAGSRHSLFVDFKISRNTKDSFLPVYEPVDKKSKAEESVLDVHAPFVPGECHAHIFMNGMDYHKAVEAHKTAPNIPLIRAHLKEYQKRGITFIRDGGDHFGASAVARKLAPEYGITYITPGFALFRKGRYGSVVGLPFDSRQEYQELVKILKKQGGDFVKFMTTGIMDFKTPAGLTSKPLAAEDVKWMTEIAHEEGLKVMSHTNGAQAVIDAAEAGVDSIEHGNFQNEESIRCLKEHDTIWVPTAVTVQNLIGCGRFDDRVLKEIVSGVKKNILYARKIGVQMALGSDAGAYMVLHGQGILDEYAFFRNLFPNDPTLDAFLKAGEDRIRAFVPM